jgi:hypothetical protein
VVVGRPAPLGTPPPDWRILRNISIRRWISAELDPPLGGRYPEDELLLLVGWVRELVLPPVVVPKIEANARCTISGLVPLSSVTTRMSSPDCRASSSMLLTRASTCRYRASGAVTISALLR